MLSRLFVHDVEKWQQNCQCSHEIEHARVHSYSNAVVLPIQRNWEFKTPDGVYQGGVCSSDFEFIAGHVRQFGAEHSNWNCDEAYTVPHKDVVYRDEKVVFGGCLIDHFGHALLEGTSRLWYLLDAPEDVKIVFLRYQQKTQTPFDALKFVELMGVDMSRVEVITEPTQFKEIIVPDETIFALNAYRPEHIRVFDAMRAHVPAHSDTTKVYLSRRKFSYRTSLNEEYYEEFFSRRGFTVIYPETLPIEEQIAYIAGADEIVTMMGSMAHLLLFAKPDVKATILNRSGQCLVPQIIVDQARGIEPYYVDAYINPLPVPHVTGPFLFGPNRFFQAYLDERGIDYDLDELQIDKNMLCSFSVSFIEEWAKLYANPDQPFSPGTYRTKDILCYGMDYMRQLAQMLGTDEDDLEDILLTQTVLTTQTESTESGSNISESTTTHSNTTTNREDKDTEIKKLKAKIKKLKKANIKLKNSTTTLTADLKKANIEIDHLRNSKS
ncbi:MAG TPA: glycosyltransferase family 61 protein, partial [Methanocorpusculum sp.]|nr:glycosyltransferase family 61 protein [Methanocorpusculum sp.]